jgi:peroxiredoxin
MRLRIFLSIFLLLLFGELLAQSLDGSKAFSFQLKDPAGKIINLDSLRGNWVLLDFWASWCGPCRIANRVVRQYYPKWKENGVEVLGVSLDQDRKDWINAIRKDRISWLQVNTPAQWDSELVLQWRIERIPTTYLIDPEGTIRATDPDPKSILSFIQKSRK